MPTMHKKSPGRDPRLLSIQMSIRMPFWRREQLEAEADAMHVAVSTLIMDALDRVYPPTPPPR